MESLRTPDQEVQHQFRELIRSGRLTACRVGNRLRVDPAEVYRVFSEMASDPEMVRLWRFILMNDEVFS